MKSNMIAVALLALSSLLSSAPGSAASVGNKIKWAEDGAYAGWLMALQKDVPLIPMPLITASQRIQGDSHDRLPALGRFIVKDSEVLEAYIARVERLRRRYGDVGPYDRELMAIMKGYQLGGVEATLREFDALSEELGIHRAPPLRGGLADAAAATIKVWKIHEPPQPGDERYDEELPGRVRFDGKRWQIVENSVAKPNADKSKE